MPTAGPRLDEQQSLVARVVEILRSGLEVAMALLGCASVAELDRVTGGGFVRGSVLLGGGDPWWPVPFEVIEAEFGQRRSADDRPWFAIEADGKYIGGCGLFHFDWTARTGEIGIGNAKNISVFDVCVVIHQANVVQCNRLTFVVGMQKLSKLIILRVYFVHSGRSLAQCGNAACNRRQ